MKLHRLPEASSAIAATILGAILAPTPSLVTALFIPPSRERRWSWVGVLLASMLGALVLACGSRDRQSTRGRRRSVRGVSVR